MQIPDIGPKGLRDFALTMGAVIAGLFGLGLPWLFDLSYRVWPWVVAALLCAWGLSWPSSLRWVYRAWMRFGLALNRITTPLILGIVFYVVIAPLALLRKGVSRDPLAKDFDRSVDSYRVPTIRRAKEQLERPF